MDNPPDFMAQWDYQDPAATALRFRRLLEEAPAGRPAIRAGAAHPDRPHPSLQRQFAQARQLLDEIEPCSPTPPASPAARLAGTGRTFNSAGDKASARTLFEQGGSGLKLGRQGILPSTRPTWIAIAAPLEEQSRWHQLAMTLAERSADDKARGWLPSPLQQSGLDPVRAGAVEEARACQQNAWPGTSSTPIRARPLSPAGAWHG